ncbi:MAG: PorT family protein [Bacteroidaceae bacterium]|nr:PorT family protein [Bacteroidaceae bacterium]
MKRLAVFLLSVACCLLSVHAQVGEPRTDLAVGMSGGVALNQVSFKPAIKQSMKPGATVGFTARYTCEKYFSLLCAFQGELNYSMAGWKENPETSAMGYDGGSYQRTVHYVQMPLLANLGYGRERGGLKGFLVVGPQLSFCIGETVKTTGDGAGYVPHQLDGLQNQHELKVQRKFEYGITGGLGIDFSTKKGHHFILEGRYFYGLSDMFKNSKKDPFARSANSTIIAKVSYLFDIKRTNL